MFDPILFLFCNIKLSQKENFGPRYPEKYVPHLFNFLKNYFWHDKLLILFQKYKIQSFHFMDIIIVIIIMLCLWPLDMAICWILKLSFWECILLYNTRNVLMFISIYSLIVLLTFSWITVPHLVNAFYVITKNEVGMFKA